MRHRLGVPALSVFLLVVCCGSGNANPRPSDGCSLDRFEAGARLERSVDVDGVTRRYILHVPNAVVAHRPAAVLLDFHGWGHSAAGVWRVSRFKELAERDGFITVYPDGLPVRLLRGESRPGWEITGIQGNRDLAFTNAILDRLEKDYCIDRSRVYSTGFSNGAFFSHILGCAMSDRIAAIAPVAGGRITVPCKPGRAIPVLIYHGTADEVVPLRLAREARDQWLAIADCSEAKTGSCSRYSCTGGVEIQYCEVPLGHTWPAEATERIWDFLRRYSAPAPQPTRQP